MAGPLNAKVILARCSITQKSFGIRIEQRESDWVRTWAFPVDEQKAKREKFDANTVTGSLEPVDEYPGCPHCKNMGFVQCACGKTGCMGNVQNNGFFPRYVCPWCGEKVGLRTVNSFNVFGGGY